LNAFLDPIRERRAHYENQKGFVDEVIYTGTRKVRQEVQKTLYEMRKAMGFVTAWRSIERKASERMKTQSSSESEPAG